MKKLIVLSACFIFLSCNLSDATYELPGGYFYNEEGLYGNTVIKNNRMVIKGGAFGYSHDDNYLMFVYDTVRVENAPRTINNQKLFYLVNYIRQDSLSKPMNYSEYKNFILKNKIDPDDDLSLGNYSKYSPR